jgi:Glycosyl hydrolase family 26
VSTPGASIPIGVYRGRGCGMPAINAYEAFIGRDVQLVVDFMIEEPTTWAEFEKASLTSSTDVSVWQNVLGQRRLALGVPACCGASTGSGGKTWTDEANGVNDAHWEALGNHLIGLGLGNAVLRIGREFNGSWYPWQVKEGGQASYIAGYSHVVTVLRRLAGADFRFCWNPTLGQGNLTKKGAESCYPGDGFVDEIGLDVYDWTQKNSAGTEIYPGNAAATTTVQQHEVLDILLTEPDSVRGWYSLALNHAKPLSFPEWGLVLWKTGTKYLGGGDNAVFVRGMADFMSGCSLFGWHAMWEDPWGAGVSDPDTKPGRPIPAPMSRAEFLEAFGS